ncbi:MAG: hypothetical protein R2827_12070 [Bdellovibrionales bacterium]
MTLKDREVFLHLGLDGKALTSSELTIVFNSEYRKVAHPNGYGFEVLCATDF